MKIHSPLHRHFFFQINELSKSLETEDPQNGRAWGDHLLALIQSGLAALDARIEESMMPIADKVTD